MRYSESLKKWRIKYLPQIWQLLPRRDQSPSSLFNLQESAIPAFSFRFSGEEDKLDQFNLPCYAPAVEEVKQMIRAEGSFSIRKFEIFTVDWAPSANREDGKKVRLDNQESQASRQAT
ncbi:hypothetical protein Patl1_36467 [Pistacia atlantica]|nr:hypothetical protein Patl1_36467 [Pistacia atlantica]